MKTTIFFVLTLSVISSAFAFDSDRWHQKREAILMEANRMREVYAKCVKHLETPAEDVVVPIETFPDGSVKSIIHAEKAQYFLKEGLVWAQGVTVRKFKKDGRLDTIIMARNCVVDRVLKAGWAEGRAQVTHGKTVLSGSGVYFSSPEGYVKVFNDSKVDSTDLKMGGIRP